MIHNHYHIKNHVKFDLPKFNKSKKVNQEKFSLDVVKEKKSEPSQNLESLQKTEHLQIYESLRNLEPPKAPVKYDYTTEITHSNGSREILFDKEAYEQAMAGYFKEKTEYDAKINEHTIHRYYFLCIEFR